MKVFENHWQYYVVMSWFSVTSVHRVVYLVIVLIHTNLTAVIPFFVGADLTKACDMTPRSYNSVPPDDIQQADKKVTFRSQKFNILVKSFEKKI